MIYLKQWLYSTEISKAKQNNKIRYGYAVCYKNADTAKNI